MRKAEILRERLIEDAERMREIDPAMSRDFASRRRPPGRAREIAESIDRNNGRLIEGADVECRGKMRQMMLYLWNSARTVWPGKACSSRTGSPARARRLRIRLSTKVDVGALGQEIADLAHEVGATVLIERDVLHIRKLNACLSQAIGDSMRRKSRPMLDAAESLLLGGRNQLSVSHQRGRRNQRGMRLGQG